MTVLDSEGNFGRTLRLERGSAHLQLQRYFLELSRKDSPTIFGRTLAVEPWG